MRRLVVTGLLVIMALVSRGSYILIGMDETQSNHLKAYGIAFWVLTKDVEVDWLLNYRGGSFMVKYSQQFENECIIRGVSYEVISDANANGV